MRDSQSGGDESLSELKEIHKFFGTSSSFIVHSAVPNLKWPDKGGRCRVIVSQVSNLFPEDGTLSSESIFNHQKEKSWSCTE